MVGTINPLYSASCHKSASEYPVGEAAGPPNGEGEGQGKPKAACNKGWPDKPVGAKQPVQTERIYHSRALHWTVELLQGQSRLSHEQRHHHY